MANEINVYEPRYLAEAVRTAPPICTFLRDRFFSKVKTFPTKNVDIDIVKGNRKMAAFVHPMVGGEIEMCIRDSAGSLAARRSGGS